MSDIQHLIIMLQSNNPDKRFDACEELRVSPSLPPEALEALRLVTTDANPDVADAAQRALALHIEMKNEPDSNSQNQRESELPLTTKLLFAVFGGGIFGCLSLAIVANLGGMWESWPWIGLFLGAPIGILVGLVVIAYHL